MKSDPAVLVVEREREIEVIAGALASALDGDGGVLLIEGPPGIGKTTLALAAIERARASGMRVLRAVGTELERDFGYGVVRQWFDPVLREAARAERAQLMDGAGGAASALELGVVQTPEGSEFATLHGLYWLLANLSDLGPVLLVLDDAQWADLASLRLLAFLAPRIADLPVLLLVCAREGEWQPESMFAATASDLAVRPLLPAPLSAEAAAALVHERFAEPVDDAFCAACHQVSAGNPFLLRTLLDELVNDRIAPVAASVEMVLELRPRSVTRAIVARLGRLSPAARSLAATIAVLGTGASAEETRELTGLSADALWEASGELVRVAILDPGPELRFAHPLVRNAVYGDLGGRERDRLHRRAAVTLERLGAPAERIALQLLQTQPAGDAQTCAILRSAARSAIASGATRSALAYLRRALAEPCPADDQVDLLIELADVESRLDGHAAIEHLREAIDLNRDPARHSRIATQLARALVFTNATTEGADTALRALSQLGDGEDERDLRRRLESTILVASSHDLALVAARERVLAELDDVAQEPGLGARRLQSNLCFSAMMNVTAPAATVAAHAQALLADGLPLREDNGGTAMMNLVQVLIAADSELALSWLDRGLERARQTGDDYAVACNLFFRCIAHLHRGELSDAILDGTEALREIDRCGVDAARGWCASQVALAQTAAGDFAAAEAATAVIAPLAESPTRLEWPYLMIARRELKAARGDARGFLDLVEEMLETRPRRVPSDVIWVGKFLSLAVGLARLGEQPERARQIAEEEVACARSWNAPAALGRALRAHAMVVGDVEGEASLREAVAALDGSIAKLEHALALVDLGALLRRSGRRKEARGPLRDGLVLARVCGAGPLIARAEDELRAAGSSPRNVIQVGVDTLTVTERRVAQLAAEGLTNKQIAQALFVTVKTVEMHLSRTYQKLDVNSRAQLATALEPAPLA